jgi:hypothetical protein
VVVIFRGDRLVKIIRITVKEGTTKVDYIGYQGKQCDVADERLRNSLGKITGFEVVERKNKPEYYEGEHSEDMLRSEE